MRRCIVIVGKKKETFSTDKIILRTTCGVVITFGTTVLCGFDWMLVTSSSGDTRHGNGEQLRLRSHRALSCSARFRNRPAKEIEYSLSIFGESSPTSQDQGQTV